MAKTLYMTFKLEGAKEVTISLADPKADLKKADVETVMNDIITKKAVIVKGLAPIGIKEAFVRDVTDSELA